MEQQTTARQARRRLTRVRDGRMFAGVANGIAQYLDIDPWLVRAAFVGFSFAGGSGVVIYLLGILAMPRELDPPGSSPMERLLSGNARRGPWLLALLLLVIFLVFNGDGVHRHFFIWPLALIGLGVWFFRDRWDHDDEPNSSPVDAATPVDAAMPVEAPTTVTTPAYGRAQLRYRTRPRRQHSALRMLTVGAATVALGVTIALTQSDVIHLRIQQVLAVPMVVLGIGLLIGTFVGRARTLVVPALLLLPFTVAASLANVPLQTSAGAHTYRPSLGIAVQPTYSLGVGRLVVDLSKVAPNEFPSTVKITQGAGEMVVVIPTSVPVSINASEGAGLIELLGRTTNGASPRLIEQTTGDGPVLRLQLRNGFGRTFVTDNPNSPEANQ